MLSVFRPVHLILFVISCPLCLLVGCGSSSTDGVEGKTDSVSNTVQNDSPIPPESIPALSTSTSPPVPTYSDEAFRVAAHDGNIDLVRQAIKSGTQVDAVDPSVGYTALLMAAYNGHTEIVKLLLDKGAEVDVRDHEGKTPLMHACTGPFIETVRLLIDAGADVNTVESTEGFTPLMTAAALGQQATVELLLQHSADKNVVDEDGDTAMSHAINTQNQEIADLLK